MRSEGKIELFNEDCMLTMKRIASGTVDLILTDPPYNTTQCEWEYDIDLTALWAEWKRILKPNGVICVFADEPFTSRLIMSNLDWFKIRITWDKMTGSNFLNAKKMPLKQTEDVVIFSSVKNGQYTYNPILTDKPKHNIRPIGNRKPQDKTTTYGKHNGQYSDDYDPTKNYPTNLLSIMAKQDECNSVNRWHPTQKPTEIMQWFVKTFSNQHELVFDGYSGSGVTAIACEIENRNFIGSELNEEYFKKALKRIKDETAQTKLF
jgi:site-specific DNA-methyltransferase (adenine-specific)